MPIYDYLYTISYWYSTSNFLSTIRFIVEVYFLVFVKTCSHRFFDWVSLVFFRINIIILYLFLFVTPLIFYKCSVILQGFTEAILFLRIKSLNTILVILLLTKYSGPNSVGSHRSIDEDVDHEWVFKAITI